ncbi:MAG: cupin domain-containing protein [Proteobacteria bacterium]|jgi:quercetin dioxygenase-like cupin family protein|nr:cupin domain-containing protein [Pseudomonadota bacterium]
MSERTTAPLRRFEERPDGYRWQGVDRLAYKDDGAAPFRDVTRQTLFSRGDLAGELRYFEVAPGGYSTLERHRHVHAVLILRGGGTALVGEETFAVGAFDLVTVPPGTWHQFRAGTGGALGFLCMVDAKRDRPEVPDEAELARLRANPALAAFLR